MRIAIVNDMKLAVQLLRRLLASREEYELAWIAFDGKEAAKKCASDTPDLILMDLIMPVMGGTEATKVIMKESPCPILIVTASVDTNASLVFEAMGYGALDAVNTPMIGRNGEVVGGEILENKIETIASLHNKSSWVPKKRKGGGSLSTSLLEAPKLVVIGASTGGPLALVNILKQFPKEHQYAVALIQHIDEKFSRELAVWLQSETGLKVELAVQGGRPEAGVVHLAGTNNHLILNKLGMYEYTPHPKEKMYRPSVDVFFSSVADCWPEPGVGVLLTGMGDDGGVGMKELHDKKWHTIAQSKESCVVYGMPKAAVDNGAASISLNIDEIPAGIFSALVFRKAKKRSSHD